MTASYIVIKITDLLINTCSAIIFINILLSWVLPPNHSIKQFLNFLTAPILRPIRKLLQPLMAKSSIPLDLSPIIAILLLSLLRQLLYSLWVAIL